MQAQHQVRVLDCLTRRALHQVVDRAEHEQRGRTHAGGNPRADAHHVAMLYVGQRGEIGGQLHEGLAGVHVTKRRQRIVDRARERHRDRGQNAAVDGEQVRREQQIAVSAECGEAGAHLEQMTMRIAHAVRAEVLRHLGEQQFQLGRCARATHAAGRRDVHRRARCDQTRLRQRGERHQNARGVAPRIGHHACAMQRGAKELRQSVRRIERNTGRRVIGAAVSRTQIAREVDHTRPRGNHLRHPLRRRAMRQGREHQIGARQIDLVRTHHRNGVYLTASLHAQRGAALRIRRGEREAEVGMTEDEGAELAP